MRVLLDQEPCDVSADSVRQAIAAAAAVAEQRGRRIVEITVDGQHWTAEHLDDAARGEATADEVHLITADPIELVCQTFRDACCALTDADLLQQSAADLLQLDNVAQAMQQLNEAITVWLSIQQAAVMGCELAGISMDACRVPLDSSSNGTTIPAEEIIERLNTQLRAIRTSLELGDTVALSDALLYDFPEIVQEWRSLFAALESMAQR